MTLELSKRRRKAWFERIYSPGFLEADAPRYVRVCANHFVHGKPSALFDIANADWAPSINLAKPIQTKSERMKRVRNDQRKNHTSEQSSQEGSENIPGVACQTDITCEGFSRLEDMYKKVLEDNIALKKELRTFKGLSRGHMEVDEPLTNSDYEGPTEKLEIILKTEPDADFGPQCEPDTEVDPLALPCHDFEDSMIPGSSNSNLKDSEPDTEEEPESCEPSEEEPKRRKCYQQKRAKRFPCSDCSQKFISRQALDIHFRIHSGERPFECSVCQRGFSVASTLKAHMRTHTGERPFACQMCPRRFSEHGTLKCHMRTHTGERPYECEVCHKKFTENSTLRRHLLTHTGERPFECEMCPSKFIQKYNLNNHIRRVHTGTILGL